MVRMYPGQDDHCQNTYGNRFCRRTNLVQHPLQVHAPAPLLIDWSDDILRSSPKIVAPTFDRRPTDGVVAVCPPSSFVVRCRQSSNPRSTIDRNIRSLSLTS